MKKVITLLLLCAVGASTHAQTQARTFTTTEPTLTHGFSSMDSGLSSVDFLTPTGRLHHPARISVDRGPSTVDPIVSPLYQTNAAPLNAKKFSIPGEKAKKIGSAMTVLGGAVIVGGIVLYASGDPNYERTTYNSTTNQYETVTIDPKRVGGVLLVVMGTAVAVPGIFVWRKGVRDYNRYMQEQGGQALRLGVGGNGAALTYRF